MEEEATQPGIPPSFTTLAHLPPSELLRFGRLRLQETMVIDTFYKATQIVVDPRRLGQANSGLNEDDLADICCILHPASIPAYEAAAHIHELNPDNTIITDRNVPVREKYNDAHTDIDTFELVAKGIDSYDLVLRLSANLKDGNAGFHFGRNPQRCDFLIGQKDKSRRISNIHFRIYINEHGTLMLEDQSTNGTAIDGTLLRGKEKENHIQYRHTIENGSIITLTMTPPEEDYKFHVRIPQRDTDADTNAYEENLTAWFLRNQNRAKKNVAATNGTVHKPLNLFPKAGTNPNTTTSMMSTRTRRVKEWRGGPKYNRAGIIGKGAFAVVYKLTAKFDGMPYAAKELEKRRFTKNGLLDQKIDSEMKIMSKIKHPNIVGFIEHVDWEDYLYIIMEFVPGGDLGTWINQEQFLPEFKVKAMAGQLLSALKYLHDSRITHRDVKPDNILIYSKDPIHVKLTDFGLSKMIDSEETFLRTFCGTLLYCAPEVYSEYREYDENNRRVLRGIERSAQPKQRYGHAVDIWSLAGVLFYSLCGSPPYPVQGGTSYQELLNHIMTQPLDIRPLQRVEISESGIRFVRSMLHNRPQYRATIPELEASSWLTGVESMEMSMEESAEYAGDSVLDSVIEAGTSQLSIQANGQEDDHEEMEDDISDLTDILPIEFPETFDSEANISLEDSKENINPRNGRLFGEVNPSVLGSSGALTREQLSLPLSTGGYHPSTNSRSEYGNNSRIEDSSTHLQLTAGFLPTIVAVPPVPNRTPGLLHPETEDRAVRSSSLMGAESMVGHLNMHSPASAASPAPAYLSAISPGAGSPAPDSPVPTIEAHGPTIMQLNQNEEGHDETQAPANGHFAPTTQMPTMSLRRPREEEYEDSGDWQSADQPAKRRRKSAREINLLLPLSIFWDPKDKSTHHNNYPRMSTLDLQAYQELAKSKGEEFRPGQKIFETTMQSFRSSRSRSTSADPENQTRAHSEPTKEGARPVLMKRDERNLTEVANGPNRPTNDRNPFDRLLPATAHPSDAPSSLANDSTPATTSLQPFVGNDFQPPKRILAKFISTPDSCLPTIALNITESVTSWGRGGENTVRYLNGAETKIPKYAFKVLLFKPGFNYVDPGSKITQNWQDQEMSFFISTKASMGIWINDVSLQSHSHQKPTAKSKYWVELRNGDVIDVWRSERSPELVTRLRFECYWGLSRAARRMPDEQIRVLDNGAYLDELENICMTQETAILAELAQREQKDKAVAARDREKEKLARQSAGTSKASGSAIL